MASIKDYDILLREKTDSELRNYFPITKTDNVMVSTDKSLTTYLKELELMHYKYDLGLKKLNNIEDLAEVNQNAYSKVKFGFKSVSAKNKTDTLSLAAGENISIDSDENDNIVISSTYHEVPMADEFQAGKMSRADYIKLQGIESYANNYIHPKSGVVAGLYSYIRVDDKGHIIEGVNDPVPVELGGTGVKSYTELGEKLNLDALVKVDNTVTATGKNPVSGSAVYDALLSKAEKNHGLHVPDTSITTSDGITFLANNNTWQSVRAASITQSGVIRLTSNYDDVIDGRVLTPEAVRQGDAEVKSYVDKKFSDLIGGAPETLDTIYELASVAEQHTDLLTRVDEAIGKKVDKVDGKGLSTNDYTTEDKNIVNRANTHMSNTSNPHNVTKTQIGLSDVTNDKQVKGLSSGTTEDNVVVFGADGYSIKDSGHTIKSNVPENAKFTDTIYTMSVSTDTNKYPFVKLIDSNGREVGFSIYGDDRLSVSKDAYGNIKIDASGIKYNEASESGSGFMSKSDYIKLKGIEEGANKYVHPTSGVVVGTYLKVSVDKYGHVISGSNEVIAVSEGGTGANNAKDALVNLGIKATATEINYLSGVTANIQDQLSYKVSTDTFSKHTHPQYSTTDHTHSYYSVTTHKHIKSDITDFNIQLTSENLDSYRTPGFYYSGGNNSVTNKPSGVDAFGLIVIQSAAGWTTQLLFASNNVQKSYRRWYTSSAWTSWTEDKLTDTNTWRGIQNVLTSTSTTDSLSAAQGKVLKGLIDQLNTDLNDLEIGGRNLLQPWIEAGGSCTKNSNYSITVGTKYSDTYFWLKSYHKLLNGTVYTLSCEASNVPSGTDWSFGVRNQGNVNQFHINKNGKLSLTFTLDADIEAGAKFILDDFNGKPSTPPNIVLTNFKLEKGDKATDYTPAPEDKSDVGHTHSQYSVTSHTHSIYSTTAHTHSIYSPTNHSHSQYSVTNHTHSYLPLSGGTLTGAVTCNSTITFGADDAYGIRTATNNTGSIGEKSYAFYQAYINNIHVNRLGMNSGASSTASYTGDIFCNTLTENRQYVLPDSDGQIALTHQLSIYSTTAHTHSQYSLTNHTHSFTDVKVTQTAVGSDYTNWRPLVIGSSNSGTEGFSPSTVTDGTYTSVNISCQPSSGTIRATTFKGSLSGKATSATYSTSAAYASKSSTANYATSAGQANGNFWIKEGDNIILRPGNSTYTAGIGYDTSGNECIALWAKNSVTRLRWYAGKDMSTMSTGSMMNITPDFEVSKASGSVIGYLAGNTILTSANIGSYTSGASLYPYGFDYRGAGEWGNRTGTSITGWYTSNGCAIDFRKDNPSEGKLSIKVDGRVYINEGTNPVMGMTYANGYWGMGTADGSDTDWIRTTNAGIIPYESGNAGSGHCSLGTSSWYFSRAYIDIVESVYLHGKLQYNGNAVVNTVTNSSTNFSGGTDLSNGGVLILRGKDQSGMEGRFELGAKTASASVYLVGYPNGTLTWGNAYVLTTATYSTYALPLTGGTINGTITFAASDSYGLRVATDNYCLIGDSSKYFYQSYIRYMFTAGTFTSNISAGYSMSLNTTTGEVLILYKKSGSTIWGVGTRNDNAFGWYHWSTGLKMTLSESGNLAVAGSTYTGSANTVTSDRRYKNTINDLDDTLSMNFIMSLKPSSFKYNDGTSGRTHYGFIAQDVEESMKNLGMTTKDFAGLVIQKLTKETEKKTVDDKGEEYIEHIIEDSDEVKYGLRYEEFISPLIKVVQMQQKQIEELKNEITELKTLISQA